MRLTTGGSQAKVLVKQMYITAKGCVASKNGLEIIDFYHHPLHFPNTLKRYAKTPLSISELHAQ